MSSVKYIPLFFRCVKTLHRYSISQHVSHWAVRVRTETFLMPEGKSIQKSVKSTTKLIKLQAVICHRDIIVIIKLGIVMAVTKCRYVFWWKTILDSKSPFILVNMQFCYMVLFTPVYRTV